MIQQLSLFGSLPDSDAPIMRQTLSVMTGMQPRDKSYTVLVWEPVYLFRPTLAAGEVNQIEQYRIFMCCQRATPLPKYPLSDDEPGASQVKALYAEQQWKWSILEVPEPGRGLRVISQQVYMVPVAEGDPFAMLTVLGYRMVRQFYTLGHEFVLKNVVLQVFRVHKLEERSASIEQPEEGVVKDGLPESPPETAEPNPSSLFDRTGQWTCKAWVDVGSVSDLPAIEVATAELLSFQQDLKGLVTLEVPARNCFDTRMRSF